MTSKDFTYWLSGFLEATTDLSGASTLDSDGVALIREKLSEAFRDDIDKQYADPEAAQNVHDGYGTEAEFYDANPHLVPQVYRDDEPRPKC